VEVRTLVIPAAGLGTRFLPATAAVPKELLPIGDTPAIQLVIDEALAIGVDHVIVVSSAAKPAIDRYLTPDDSLIATLRDRGRDDVADRLAAIGRDWRVTIVHQDHPRGLGHAVGCARGSVSGDAVVVSLPDEIMGGPSLLARMRDVCAATGGGAVGLLEVEPEAVSSYGVIDPAGPVVDGVVPVRDLVEKPAVDVAPSRLILIGRYVLTVDVFDEIERLRPGSGGEIQLTDALRAQAARSPFHGVVTDTERWDTGTPIGFLAAAVEIVLGRPGEGDELARALAGRLGRP
jgi:UTP--glucose-1-phosphate uridylyltransferase